MPAGMTRGSLTSWLAARSTRSTGKPFTHTRIGSAARGITGGSYHIADSELAEFNQLYHKHVFVDGHDEYLTEKQREVGTLLVDLDFRYDVGTDTRQHTDGHLYDIVECYVEIVRDIVDLSEGEPFNVWVMEKPSINPQPTEVKDGIHLAFGIAVDRATRRLIRDRALEDLAQVLEDLPLTNSIDTVIDEGVALGTCQWQLYGSHKPGNETYTVVQAYKVSEGGHRIDEATGCVQNAQTVLRLASARSSGAFRPVIREAWAERHEAIKAGLLSGKSKKEARKESAAGPAGPASAAATVTSVMTPGTESAGLDIEGRTIDEIRAQVEVMLDELPFHEAHLRDAHAYAMALGPEYYEPRAEWLRVGWALRNTSSKLFPTWVLFSARWKKFRIGQLEEMRRLWEAPQPTAQAPLTNRSLAYWCRVSNKVEYERLRQSSISQAMELSLQGMAEFDIATVMHRIYHNDFRCASIKDRLWYQYTGHYWKKIDEGTTLRMQISQYLSPLYREEVNKFQSMLMSMEEGDEAYDRVKKKAGKFNNIAIMLKKTGFKNNVMRECCELFHDPEFLDKLDKNPMLLGCANGVIDFEKGKFRPGLPDDYISIVTPIHYDPSLATSEAAASTRAELEDFMAKLFTNKDLREYVWEHLSSVLVGNNENQTFNLYTGDGENGKSKLVELMTMMLGPLKGTVPVSLVTSKRTTIGSVSPEVAELKPCLYAVMQEPSKGDSLNEGILKELTGGSDPIQGRGLYQNTVTYVPKFSLVVCLNNLFAIKSDDHGTWRRMAVIEFSSKFVDEPDPSNPKEFRKDKKLDKNFPRWAPVMLVMLAERAFKNKGEVRLCEAVQLASSKYRCSQDHIAEFLNERVERAANRILKKEDVAEEFKDWHRKMYGTKGPPGSDVFAQVTKKFGEPKKLRGCTGWPGLAIAYEGHGSQILPE